MKWLNKIVLLSVYLIMVSTPLSLFSASVGEQNDKACQAYKRVKKKIIELGQGDFDIVLDNHYEELQIIMGAGTATGAIKGTVNYAKYKRAKGFGRVVPAIKSVFYSLAGMASGVLLYLTSTDLGDGSRPFRHTKEIREFFVLTNIQRACADMGTGSSYSKRLQDIVFLIDRNIHDLSRTPGKDIERSYQDGDVKIEFKSERKGSKGRRQ